MQIAKALGATVTGVCGPGNVDLVRSLGAREVIDYTKEDFTRSGRRYDILLDMAGSRPPSACRRALTREGVHVVVGGPAGRWLQPVGYVVAAFAAAPFVPQRVALVDVVRCTRNKRNLMTLTELIEDGRVTPVIDRCYPFQEIPAALGYQERGHAAGKVVITV